MKHRSGWKWVAGVSLTAISLTTGYMQTAGEAQAPDRLAVETAEETGPDAAAPALPAETDAPAKLVSSDKPLPGNIKPNSAVDEVIKLANSGVNESVMLAYVTNSGRAFNLGADEIIYLNDIGVPGAVVNAMLQRDQELKTAFGGGATPPLPGPEVSGAMQDQPSVPGPESSVPYAEAPLTPSADTGDEMFYDSLAPYGNWVDVEGYGRCWQPTVVVANAGWQPYFDCGHWVYSDCGWYWASDYSWGWAPFHYGRWFHHGHLGWCWTPGHVWGPSWVSWRFNDNYCGWAPLPPGAHFVAGVGLTFRGHHVGERDDFGLGRNHYHFVDWGHFHERQLRPHGLGRHQADGVFEHSVVATRINGDGHTVINNGLPPSRVAAATHRPIHTVALRDAARPVPSSGRHERVNDGNHTLSVYRPQLRASAGSASASLRHPSTSVVSTPGASSSWAPHNPDARTPVISSSPTRPSMTHQGSPLILRGAQPSGLHESTPPTSLVVVGRRNPSQPSAPSAPSQPSSPSAESAHPAWARYATGEHSGQNVPSRRPSADHYQNQSSDWRGTVTSSPQPSWFGGSAAGRPAAVPAPAHPESRPEVRTYPSFQRPMTQVPRAAAPTPNYVPQRSYSAPAQVWSSPSRAPSFSQPSAPSAAAARPAPPAQVSSPPPSSGSRSSSSNRNGR